MRTFQDFFKEVTLHDQPHSWQSALAAEGTCTNRMIRIPTGLGKTHGVLAAWLWNRVIRQDERWPRRLVWCLPIRVLVEQTQAETEKALQALNLLWESGDHAGKVGIHPLMGGANAGEWHLYPEECAVLIGTQDMLLSRAMNRGYASPRARWTMEFGLLNQDSLWVMDEVQLMDVGLATSTQLQAFRDDDAQAGKAIRPCRTWWMSATLQRDWLLNSPDTQGMAAAMPEPTRIPAEDRRGQLWEEVSKPCQIVEVKDDKVLARDIARLAAQAHLDNGKGAHGPTLVVVNKVDRAVEVHAILASDKSLKGTDRKLIHSRFRPAERASWRAEFLNRAACAEGTDRIIVTTQVVEAGVDISASILITELAPWASLVQRFGRAARWGGTSQVYVLDCNPKDDKTAAPYLKADLDAAREALKCMTEAAHIPQKEYQEGQAAGMMADVAPLHLETFEERHPELLARLYPYEPRHLLLRHELDELFDTTPDLSGADIDISRFIRSGEERDLQVFWADLPENAIPDSDLRPSREALCAVPFLKARDWLCGKESATAKAPRLKTGKRAWVWDWLSGVWRRAERRDLYPGQTVLVAAACGGYDPARGWSAENMQAVPPVTPATPTPDELADARQDDESLSASPWRTIATHGYETGTLAGTLARALIPSLAGLFDLAGRWHDVGKAFPAFQGSIKPISGKPDRQDLAKAPKSAWLTGRSLYPMPEGGHRPGFRHELASTLALFAVLQRHAPDHPALLGPWRELLSLAGLARPASTQEPEAGEPGPLEQEIIALDADLFNILAFLICAHHGKIGLAWHVCPADQDAADAAPRLRGLRDGDELPGLTLAGSDGNFHGLPAARLDLAPAAAGLNPRTGPGWTERALGLLTRHGPFALAWLESLLRAADQRTSRDTIAPDPLLEKDNGNLKLERNDSRLAQTAGGGETRHPLAPDTPECLPEHGLRAGAGGPGGAGDSTRPPAHATRHLETRLGRLTYAELAPRLAANVQTLEEWIEAGEFDAAALDDSLIETLHTLICGDLTPQLAGWRRQDVCVGQHTPPQFFHVPVLMREYSRDLEARLQSSGQGVGDRLLETLAFAEGRLLSIHPFADFNGRVTRVFLRLLLRRLDLPAVDLLPPAEEWQDYLAALRAADHLHWQPLMTIWQQRFEKGVTP